MSLRVWLPLNRDLRNLGTANYQPAGTNVVFNNYALQKGVLSKIPANVTQKILNNNEFSFACWVYVNAEDGDTTNRSMFFGNDNNSTTDPNNRKFSIFQYPTVNDLHLSWMNDSSYAVVTELDDVFPSYKWTHLAISYKKPHINVYINGELVVTYWCEYNSSSFAYDTKTIDISNDGKLLSDYRIYDHALSKKEVAELARGCVLHYPMNDTLNESTMNIASTLNPVQKGGWGGMTATKISDGYYHMRVASSYQNYWNSWTFTLPSDYLNKTVTFTAYMKNISMSSNIASTSWVKMWQGNDGQYPTHVGAGTGAILYTNLVEGQKLQWSDTLTNSHCYLIIEFWTDRVSEDTSGTTWIECDLYDIQIEEKDHATPYTPTGRNENLNTANWTGGAGYWTITSQTINEIKFTRTSASPSVIAIQNAVLKAKLPINTPITISGYLYNGDTPFKTQQTTINTQYNDVTVLSRESRDDGYFRYTFKYGNLNSNWLLHASFFGTRTEGDISYIRNMEWHITPYLKDVSGFDNHSIITGSLPLVTTPKSPRYDKCMNIDNSGTNKNYANCTIAAPQVKSASFWVYIGSSNPGYNVLFSDTPSKLTFISEYSNCICHASDSSDSIPSKFVISSTKKNAWNHFVINHLGTSTELFLNGVKLSNPETSYLTKNNTNDFYFGMRNIPNFENYWTGQVSDFRLFSRVLTQDDVDDLYKDSLSIDKSQNGYCYELNESDAQSSVDVKKNGQLKCKNYYEACPDTYDSNIYTEPDGSQWIRIFHHNNPANGNMFSSSDTFTTGVYKDADRWFKVSLCNNVSKWELMVKQKAESTSSEQKYRWIQNANPMTCAYTDVTTDKIIPNISTGYLAFNDTMGGVSKLVSTCYLRQNSNGNNGWWGAFGRYAIYYGGIEGFSGSAGSPIIKTGYLDLYLRIDNLSTAELATLFADEGNQIARIGKNSNVSANKLHEY